MASGVTDINGLPKPIRAVDSFLPSSDQAALAEGLDTLLVPRFASNAARDTKIPASPVDKRVEGMVCCVAGQFQVFRGGSWRTTAQTSGATVLKTSAQSYASSTSFVNISWQSTPESAGGASGAAATGITIGISGLYLVTMGIDFEPNATGRRVAGVVKTPGAVDLGATGGLSDGRIPVSGISTRLRAADTVRLAAGDSITARAWQDSGMNLDVTGRLSAWLIGV